MPKAPTMKERKQKLQEEEETLNNLKSQFIEDTNQFNAAKTRFEEDVKKFNQDKEEFEIFVHTETEKLKELKRETDILLEELEIERKESLKEIEIERTKLARERSIKMKPQTIIKKVDNRAQIAQLQAENRKLLTQIKSNEVSSKTKTLQYVSVGVDNGNGRALVEVIQPGYKDSVYVYDSALFLNKYLNPKMFPASELKKRASEFNKINNKIRCAMDKRTQFAEWSYSPNLSIYKNAKRITFIVRRA